ncbi:hypothetical protein ACROYT_G042123 [Oculina patagonica]
MSLPPNVYDNKYDVASYKRICAEFGVDPSSDFRLTRGANNGLGDVYIYVINRGPTNSGADYPGYNLFSDEGGAATKASQVNVRSSILGSGGRAKEAQSEFLVLVEDAIRQTDLAKSVQRYQLAIDEAKEGYHSKDKQPGVLSQKTDGLTSGFEKKAHNRANEP